MNGWIDGWMDGWMGEYVDGLMSGKVDRWMVDVGGCTDK